MIRGRRKQKAREIAQNRIAVEVPKADALIVNPTHIAIAIRYERGTDNAPRVTAKGKDKVADMMRQLAMTTAFQSSKTSLAGDSCT